MKQCPKCGGSMSIGAPHDEGYIYQYECLNCPNIVPVYKGQEDA